MYPISSASLQRKLETLNKCSMKEERCREGSQREEELKSLHCCNLHCMSDNRPGYYNPYNKTIICTVNSIDRL